MTTEKLSLTNYRSMIPFHVLLDLELSANALRMYGLIEQMESTRDKVYFTISYLASQLGLEDKQTRRASKELRDKGYIEHFQVESGGWLWRTRKRPPEQSADIGDQEDVITGPGGGLPETRGVVTPRPGGGLPETRGVVTPRPGGWSSGDHHNIQNINIQTNTKETTTNTEILPKPSGSNFVISVDVDFDLIRLRALSPDDKASSSSEFLEWCKYWITNICKASDETGKILALKSIIKKYGLSKPAGFGEVGKATPHKHINPTEYLYQGYCSSFKGYSRLNMLREDAVMLNFDDWLASGEPEKIQVSMLNI